MPLLQNKEEATAKEVIEGKLYEQYDLEVVENDPESYTGGYFEDDDGEEKWFKHRGMAIKGTVYTDVEYPRDDYWIRLLDSTGLGVGTYDITIHSDKVKFRLLCKEGKKTECDCKCP